MSDRRGRPERVWRVAKWWVLAGSIATARAGGAQDQDDWPTYMHDARRSGMTRERLPRDLELGDIVRVDLIQRRILLPTRIAGIDRPLCLRR